MRPIRRFHEIPLGLCALLALTPSPVFAEPRRSPFQPPADVSAGLSAGQGETYELAGAASSSTAVEICLYDKATRRSRWLAVGRSEEGIQVVSYDGNIDQAVVRFDGREHVLGLRKARTSSSGPMGLMAAAAPPGSSATVLAAPVVDPSTVGKSSDVVRQEREARMLVSDLLEISIKQRKAYEEAQKRAATRH